MSFTISCHVSFLIKVSYTVFRLSLSNPQLIVFPQAYNISGHFSKCLSTPEIFVEMLQLHNGTKPSPANVFSSHTWILEHFACLSWVMWYMKSILRRHVEERNTQYYSSLYSIQICLYLRPLRLFPHFICNPKGPRHRKQ